MDFISLKICIKLIIFCLMFYQIIEFTVQYLSYATVVKTELKFFKGKELPSITICCKDHDWRFSRKEMVMYEKDFNYLNYQFDYLKNNASESFELDIAISQWYGNIEQIFPPFEENEYFDEMSEMIIHNISSFKCITFFSKLNIKGNINIKKYLRMRSERVREMETPTLYLSTSDTKKSKYYFQLHSDDVIPISVPLDQYVITNNNSRLISDYDAITTYHHLLPSPYDTHCFDYQKYYQDKYYAKIINENLQFLSHSDCKRWKFHHPKESNLISCKLDCQIKRFYIKHLSNYISSSENTYFRNGLFFFMSKMEEHFYHFPAITLIDYFCSIGGVIGIWIGHHVWLYVTQFFLLFSKIKVFSSLIKHFKTFLLLLCFSTSLYQTYKAIEQYLSFEYIIHMSNDIHLIFPEIRVNLVTSETNFKNINILTPRERKFEIEKRFNIFSQIECYFTIENDFNVHGKINCSDYYDEIEYYEFASRLTDFYRIKSFHKKNNKINDGIFSFDSKPVLVIQINFTSETDSLRIFLNKNENNIVSYAFKSNSTSNKKYDVSFVQKSIQSSSFLYKTNCINYPTDQYDSINDCRHVCINLLFRKYFGCDVQIKKYNFKYILPSNYNICDIYKLGFTFEKYIDQYHEFFKRCSEIDCINECSVNLYNYNTVNSEFIEKLTMFRLFPLEKPHIKYTQTQKIDLNELFYQIGGTLGLWFGLSCYSFIIQLISIIHLAKRKLLALIIAKNIFKNNINNKINPIEEYNPMEKTNQRRESIVIPAPHDSVGIKMSFISLKNCIKLIIFCLMFYQIIEFTVQYLSYATVVKTELKFFKGKELPSITICCKDHDWRFSRKEMVMYEKDFNYLNYQFDYLKNNASESFELDIAISQWYGNIEQIFPPFEENEYFDEMTEVIIHNISSFKCITFFSKLNMKGKIDMKKYLLMRSENMKEMETPILCLTTYDTKKSKYYFQLHSDDVIPTSVPLDQYVTTNNSSLKVTSSYATITTYHHLLPSPYDTHCFHYQKNYQDEYQAKIVKENQFLSHSDCERWKFDHPKESNLICKLDCQIKRFYIKHRSTDISSSENTYFQSDLFFSIDDMEEHFYHLPAITLIDYFCSIGGIIGIWIGHHVWLYVTQFCLLFSKTKAFSPLIKPFKIFLLLLCFLTLLYQTYKSIEQYLSYEYIIRMSNDNHLIFPEFQVNLLTSETNFENMNNLSFREKKYEIEKRFNIFSQIECYLTIENDFNVHGKINCSDYYDEIEYYEFVSLLNIRTKYFHKKNNKISNRLFSFDSKPMLVIENNFTSETNALEIDLYKNEMKIEVVSYMGNKKHDISFVQKNIQSSPWSYKTNCINYPTDQYESFNDCRYVCTNLLFRKYFGCDILIKKYNFKYIFTSNYNFCDIYKLGFTMGRYIEQYYEFLERCTKIDCINECSVNLYNYNIVNSEFVEKLTMFRIFPLEKPHIKYFLLQKIDLNQLIYQIGGMLGLWFSLSCYSLIIQLISIIHLGKRKLLASIIAKNVFKNNKNNKINPIEECIPMEETNERRESIVIPALLNQIINLANGNLEKLDGSNTYKNIVQVQVHQSDNEVSGETY